MDRGQWLVDLLMEKGADYAELRYQRNTELSLALKNGKPEPPEYGDAYGAAIRVLSGGVMAFASTNILTKDSLRENGLRALRSARAVAKTSSPLGLSKMKAEKGSWSADRRIMPTEVDAGEVLELLKDVDASITSFKGAKFPKRLLIFGGELEEKTYINSEGASLRSLVPRVSGYFTLTAYEGGKGSIQRTIQFGESGGWERVDSIDPNGVASQEAQAMSKVLLEGQAIQPGHYDVVVGGEVTGIMAHEACGHPQEADRILGREAAQAGESYVKKDMIGRRIGSPSLNISDNPAIPNSNGFYLYDDEGVKAEKKVLIKEGKISGFLQNRETGFELGTLSNAAARATAYSREPIIRMSNTYVEPGDFTEQELIESVKDGLFIRTFQEWNIDDIRWNNRYVGLEAYRVRGGELREPIKSPIIEVTTEVLFSSVDSVGKELTFKAATCGKGQPEQGAPVWTGGPPMKLHNLYIKSR